MKKNSYFGLVAIAMLWTSPLLSCVDSTDDRGEEEEVPGDVDGKDDSARRPTDHGTLPFGNAVVEELTSSVRFHAWQFELSGDAQIEALTNYAVRGQRRVDTVMYLYKEGANGWGRYIARNDNDGNRVYSRIQTSLSAGRYRIVVKGYSAAVRGKFTTTVKCTGDGCADVNAASCVFGTTYNEAFENDRLQALPTDVLSLENQGLVTEEDYGLIVRAVQEATYTDITGWQDALSRVDDDLINRTVFVDSLGLRSYVAYEFGAGDNSYGAFFDLATGERASSIQDGDLTNCTAAKEQCLLSPNITALRSNPAFEFATSMVVTSATGLEPAQQLQALTALQSTNPGISDLATGLTQIDSGSLRITAARLLADDTQLMLVEFYSGGTAFGQIYFADSTQSAGKIVDDAITACALFAAKGNGQLVAGDACRATSDCRSGLLCEGIFAGAGVCVSDASIAGQDNSCVSDAACGNAALVCTGITRSPNDGLCRPAWVRATFRDERSAAIPDSSTVVKTMVVRGLATVDTDVVLTANIVHPAAGQLRVTLQNPAGTEVLVYQGRSADNGRPLVINQPVFGFPGDESVNGEWRLRITDQRNREVGTLTNWSLTVTSRYD